MEVIALGALAYLLARWLNEDEERFRYVYREGSWRAYFRAEPTSYSHILWDHEGYYVCWDQPLKTEREARLVAAHWMETYGNNS